MITIRPFAPTDADPVEQFLRAQWDDPSMFAMYNVHRAWPQEGLIRQTLVAEKKGQVVGAGTLFESQLHPERLMAAVNVAPGWQRQGVGTALIEVLAEYGDSRPWLAKATHQDTAGMTFLNRHGFEPTVSTMTGLLDPARRPVRGWMMRLPAAVEGFHVMPLAEAPVSLDDVALMHARLYRQFHAWNPPIEEDLYAALEHYCGDDVIPGSHVCAMQQDELIGAANLIADPFQPEPDVAYLVNVGVLDINRVTARDLTGALIRYTMEFAGGHGLRVRFEADDTYVPHWAIYQEAPAEDFRRDFVIMVQE